VDVTHPSHLAYIHTGTAFSAALASLILHDALQLSLLSQVLTALAHEALLGNMASHAEFIHEVCRPHPGQIEVSRNIEWLLKGSQLALEGDAEMNIEEDKGQLRQDRYSLRTTPQYLGPGVEEILTSIETVTLECNSSQLFSTIRYRSISHTDF
jgi:phenylalanine ammonia-lyase